jgi:hypothetical protein
LGSKLDRDRQPGRPLTSKPAQARKRPCYSRRDDSISVPGHVAHPCSLHSTFYFLRSTFPSVLFIADSFHPIDHFAVQCLLNGDVRHRGRRRSAVPMFFTRRNPDHIARPDFLDGAVPTLNPPKPGRDDQRLAKWMCMPGSASTRLERNACATNTCRVRRLE